MLDRSRGLDLDRADASVRAALARGVDERVALLERLLELDEHLPLLLGRLDREDGPLYVGRAMVVDERGELKVASWRAPAAAAFYKSTRQVPNGVLRRRRIRTTGRRVTEIADEALVEPLPDGLTADLVEAQDHDPVAESLAQRRGARMVDVVSTLMPDQYELIAAPRRTSLVVQGAPGSGKTAVGLHRAAFLLYGDNRAYGIKPRDLLVVGPNPTFLDYIRDVLPDLGEAEVRQTTLHGLLGTSATRRETSARREVLLGQESMTALLEDVVNATPIRPVGEDLVAVGVPLSTKGLQKAFDVAMQHRGAYTDRREAFLRKALRGHPDVPDQSRLRAALSRRFWPSLRPEAVLTTALQEAPMRVDTSLAPDDAALLAAVEPGNWTRAETVLLDEASALLDGRPEDRFLHIVADEVQDLTAMELRVLGRRARRGASFTLLGDLAQAARPGTPANWVEIERLVGSTARAQRVDLRTAYRVPARALAPALALFESLEVDVPTPVAYRDGGYDVTVHRAGNGAELAEALIISVLLATDRGGSVGVIAPESSVDEVRNLLVQHELLDSPQSLDAGLSVVSDSHAHGLEFDHVVVIEPAWMVADDGAHGLRRLYVALTRCTQSLTLLHYDDLPPSLALWAADFDPPATEHAGT